MNFKNRKYLKLKEIRDAFDIEFILKKGIEITQDEKELVKVKKSSTNLAKKSIMLPLVQFLNPS